MPSREMKSISGLRLFTCPLYYLYYRAGILPDHIHLALGCGSEKSPADVALCFLNNLAFALDRDPVFQMGFFAGTFGDYDLGVIYRASDAAQTSVIPAK